MFDGHARMRIALNAPPGEQANARLSNFAELMSGGEAYGGVQELRNAPSHPGLGMRD